MGCRCRWLFAFFCLFTTLLNDDTTTTTLFALAYEDKPFYTTPQYSNITHRTYVCDRFRAFKEANGTMDLRNLLQGLEISVGVLEQGNDVFVRLNRTDKDPNNWSINETDPGIVVQILDELAARGRFTWRNSFAWVQPPNTNQLNPATGFRYSWTDVLLDAVERYDFSFAEWVHSQERRGLGISFPVGWFDASTILVQDVQTVTEFSVYAFLQPFSIEVWYLICAGILFSGVVYWVLDKMEYPKHKIKTVIADTYFSTLMFTQHHTYEHPTTHSKRIFGFSAAVWALCLVTGYTANLASLLVSEERPVIWAETLQEAQDQQIDVCVRSGAAVHDSIIAGFPGIRFQADTDFDQVYDSLRNGRCKVMASRKADFDAFKTNQDKNPQCTLEWVGRAQSITKAGPATLVDTSTYCTSIIKHVLDILMQEIIRDGVIDYFWDVHLGSLENKTLCAFGTLLEDTVTSSEGDKALRLVDVGGVFVWHGILIVVSMLVTLVESPWRRERRRERELQEAYMAAKLEPFEERPSMESYQSSRFSGGGRSSGGKPSMERLHSMRHFGERSSGGKPSMERLHSMRHFGERSSGGKPSMERLHSMRHFGGRSSGGKPSMERLHSMRQFRGNSSPMARLSMRPSGDRRHYSMAGSNLDDSERSSYNGTRYSGGQDYDDDIPLHSYDSVLRCVQLMQGKLEQLKHHAEEQNQRSRSAGSSGTGSPRDIRRKTPIKMLSVIHDDGVEEEDSSAEDDDW